MSRIHILTGEIQSGKTSLCLEVADYAKKMDLQLGGLLSPAVFTAGKKTAIDVLDLKTGQIKRLADLKVDRSSEVETRRWAFSPQAVEWGNRILQGAVPCDLLIIDELGPLEFFQGIGWVNGFDTLNSPAYQQALVVVRPSLLQEASRRWRLNRIIDLSDPEAGSLTGEDLLQTLLES